MNSRKLLLAAGLMLLSTVLASCDDDDGSRAPATLKQVVVNGIDTRTTDAAVPLEINDLEIDATNEDPAQYDDLLQSI